MDPDEKCDRIVYIMVCEIDIIDEACKNHLL